MKGGQLKGLYRKILVANRGEIACRVIRTCKRMGILTVAVYSEEDCDSLHVSLANEAYAIQGKTPAASYLNQEKILRVAGCNEVDAIHPGYGFLAENADFAERCCNLGVVFIGPKPESIRLMGLKALAKQMMEQVGVPIVPGYHGQSQELKKLQKEADRIGYPLLIKPLAGGGGKGLRRVNHPSEFEDALNQARNEAVNAFGDNRVLLERFIEGSRHIEFQVFGDSHGNLVHLHERDCSLQRRHQKILEESPSPFLDQFLCEKMAETALKVARVVDYIGSGTVEFIVDKQRNYFFIEMNTRLQVEHPVTEMRTGIDLVEWQIRIAAGESLPLSQDKIKPGGHAVEVRICAENPEKEFLPSTGILKCWEFPGNGSRNGPARIRMDTGFRKGDEVSIHYDSMLAKLVVHGKDRQAALKLMESVLRRSVLMGLESNLGFLQKLVAHQEVRKGQADTMFVDARIQELLCTNHSAPDWIHWACALRFLEKERESMVQRAQIAGNFHSPWNTFDNWRIGDPEPHCFILVDRHGRERKIRILETEAGFEILRESDSILIHFSSEESYYEIAFENENGDSCSHSLNIFLHEKEVQAVHEKGRVRMLLRDFLDQTESVANCDNMLSAPMHGNITRICIQPGEQVLRGQTLLIMEAMKMEHPIVAPAKGRVEKIYYRQGDSVQAKAQLIEFLTS